MIREAKYRLPRHLRRRYRANNSVETVRAVLSRYSLNTVCEGAICPNMCECYGRGTATFMILGNVCTRKCTFCAVENGKPGKPDDTEPSRVAQAADELGLKHVVITSVTRDDLPDGGAAHFAKCIREIRSVLPEATTEALIPDFTGEIDALKTVLDSEPHVLNHNVETVVRLYPSVRPEADYDRSITLLSNAKKYNGAIDTKSGIMVGLGEREEEVVDTMKDIRAAGCDGITIGQYLAPSPLHHRVANYVDREQFARYEVMARKLGFKGVVSDAFVRSSYHAEDFFRDGGTQ